eukprot:Amastigsp_a344630_31.p4 type:complete len:142 gc:universal Amastigsp_a344630_31:761-336(-)
MPAKNLSSSAIEASSAVASGDRAGMVARHCFAVARICDRLSQQCARMTSSKPTAGFLSCPRMATRMVSALMCALYSALMRSPSGVPSELSWPGSLAHGTGTRMSDWIETSTWRNVDPCSFHISERSPSHVPSRLRHTLPQL